MNIVDTGKINDHSTVEMNLLDTARINIIISLLWVLFRMSWYLN